MPVPNGAWRSDQPITPERWVQAREIHGYTLEAFAAKYEMDVEYLRAIERGEAQPSRELLLEYSDWSGFLPRFFFEAPPDDWSGKTSLDWHMTTYVCDDCEAKTGAEVDAPYHCADCARDLCDAHVYFWEKRTYCKQCYGRRWSRATVPPTVSATVPADVKAGGRTGIKAGRSAWKPTVMKTRVWQPPLFGGK